MARKTAFVNDVILKTLNQHQQLVSPEVKKATSLDDEVSEGFKDSKDSNQFICNNQYIILRY